jgi:hypothetical protein
MGEPRHTSSSDLGAQPRAQAGIAIPPPGAGEKVAIVGSRTFTNLDAVRDYVSSLPHGVIVISGTEPDSRLGDDQHGVDQTAIWTARKRGLATNVYLPDYAHFGRYRAPKLRNTDIARECTMMVAFWDGISGGTLDVMRKALAFGKPPDIRFEDF